MALALVIRNADAIIADNDAQTACFIFGLDEDFATSRIELDSIFDEIDHRTLKLGCVSHEIANFGRNIEA